MDIKVYAALLLVLRMVSLFFMGSVIKRQLQLFRLYIDKEIRMYRRILFVLAIAIFVGNLIPGLIDILTITGELTRSSKTINGVSLVYSGAWAITSLLSAILIWWLYRMSHTVDRSHDESEHTLMNNDDQNK
jgi:ethanolamine transporter EutH